MVLYRDAELRRHQLYAKAAWTGYTVINTTFQSTKSGGALAATWAALNYVGDQGYLDIAERTIAAVDAIREGIEQIPDLHVMVAPESNLVRLVSDTVNVFDVVDQMRTGPCSASGVSGVRRGSSPATYSLATASACAVAASSASRVIVSEAAGLSFSKAKVSPMMRQR